MNIQKFFFKIVIILGYIFRVGLLVLPVALVVVITKEGGWKYGFTFIQNNVEVALFVSFAIGFLLSMYHALSYEIIGEGPLKNYLKSKQHVYVKGSKSIEELSSLLSMDVGYKNVENDATSIIARKKVHFLSPDRITIKKEDDLFEIESKPFSSLWFIDFGRNFNNVKEIAKSIKKTE